MRGTKVFSVTSAVLVAWFGRAAAGQSLQVGAADPHAKVFRSRWNFAAWSNPAPK
jgi:hypothetical protein